MTSFREDWLAKVLDTVRLSAEIGQHTLDLVHQKYVVIEKNTTKIRDIVNMASLIKIL